MKLTKKELNKIAREQGFVPDKKLLREKLQELVNIPEIEEG